MHASAAAIDRRGSPLRMGSARKGGELGFNYRNKERKNVISAKM